MNPKSNLNSFPKHMASVLAPLLQVSSVSLARFFREGKYAISRENLANESLRNCDVRQVLCILTIFCRFKLKNVYIFPKFSSFQLFQSKIILVKCCEEVIVPPEYFFEFSVFKCEYFCV